MDIRIMDYEMETVFVDIIALGLRVNKKILGLARILIQGQVENFFTEYILKIFKKP